MPCCAAITPFTRYADAIIFAAAAIYADAAFIICLMDTVTYHAAFAPDITLLLVAAYC